MSTVENLTTIINIFIKAKKELYQQYYNDQKIDMVEIVQFTPIDGKTDLVNRTITDDLLDTAVSMYYRWKINNKSCCYCRKNGGLGCFCYKEEYINNLTHERIKMYKNASILEMNKIIDAKIEDINRLIKDLTPLTNLKI